MLGTKCIKIKVVSQFWKCKEKEAQSKSKSQSCQKNEHFKNAAKEGYSPLFLSDNNE